MESARILIAMGSEASIGKLKSILVESGYVVVDSARDGNECLRKARALKPDIVIIEQTLPQNGGYEIARVAVEDDICDVIMIGADAQKGLADDLTDESGFVFMPKPLNKIGLLNTIDLMVKSKRKIRSLEREIEELRSTLDTRKEVEKAKGLLMRHLNLSENEAFKRIQKQSMDRGIPMKEIAKAIILAYDI